MSDSDVNAQPEQVREETTNATDKVGSQGCSAVEAAHAPVDQYRESPTWQFHWLLWNLGIWGEAMNAMSSPGIYRVRFGRSKAMITKIR